MLSLKTSRQSNGWCVRPRQLQVGTLQEAVLSLVSEFPFLNCQRPHSVQSDMNLSGSTSSPLTFVSCCFFLTLSIFSLGTSMRADSRDTSRHLSRKTHRLSKSSLPAASMARARVQASGSRASPEYLCTRTSMESHNLRRRCSRGLTKRPTLTQ